MVLKTWHLFLVFGVFIGFIFLVIFFVSQAKFKKSKNLASEFGFDYFDAKNIPKEYMEVSKHLRYFWGYEFLMVGQVQGRTVFFTQYLEKMASQLPYVYAVFTLFETPQVFTSDVQRIALQKKIDEILPGTIVTENGIFYYHQIPWNVNKETLSPIIEKLVEVTRVIE